MNHELNKSIEEAAAKERAMMGEALRADSSVSGIGRGPRTASIKQQVSMSMGAMCARVNIREELVNRLVHAEEKAGERMRLEKLAYLADQHPETLEMIELMRDLNLLH